MTLDSLGQFIAALDAAGELVRVTQPVRARLELAEIADRAMKPLSRRDRPFRLSLLALRAFGLRLPCRDVVP